MMTGRRIKDHDDPVGEALAGGEGPAEQPSGSAPVMVDLDQFVTTAEDYRGDSSFSVEDDAAPVVLYESELGGRSYTLLHPPVVNGVLLQSVTMRLPEQTDIDDFANGLLENNRAMICRLTGLHPVVFRRLKWVDAQVLHEVYRDLMPSFLTGEE